MKPLFEYMMEAMKPANWNDIIPMGRLDWKFKSKDYGVDENIKCDDWNAGFGGTDDDQILLFWSPKSSWMIYVYLNEVRKNHTNWALVSLECKPAEVPSKVLFNFTNYCMEAATVPELDTISVPKEVEKMIADLKKSKPSDLPNVSKPTPKTAKHNKKQELGDKITKDEFFKRFRPTGIKKDATFGDRKALMDEIWETSIIYCDQTYYGSHYDTFYKVNKVNGDYQCAGYKHFDQWRDCHYYSQYVDDDDNIVWLMTGGKFD